MRDFLHILLAFAVIVVPIYCAWLVIDRSGRRRREGRRRDRL